MIFEHEIPGGSRLYFGKSASIKREIESIASSMLSKEGYQEIVTPLFSYHQHEFYDDEKELIRVNDNSNHAVSLRADSTVDVVRIATKRLYRSIDSSKWFYIQPVYTFPTNEQYQVGAEYIGGGFEDIFSTAMSLLESIDIQATIQIANIAIPNILNQEFGIDIEIIKSVSVEKIYQIAEDRYEWLKSLLQIHSLEDLEDLSIYPTVIAKELEKIRQVSQDRDNIVISPLFYAKLRYYDSLIFRVFSDNRLYMMGGEYIIDGVKSSGFALYSDACIAKKMQKDSDA